MKDATQRQREPQAPGRSARRRKQFHRMLASIRKAISKDWFLVVVPSTALALGILWAAVVPLWQIPDEPSHFGYVQSIGEGKGLFPDRRFARELAVANELSELDGLPFRPGARQDFSTGSTWGPREQEVISIPKRLRSQDEPGSYNSAIDYPPGYYVLASVIYRALGSQDLLTIMFGLRVFSAALTAVTVLFAYLTLRMFFEERYLARATTFLIVLSPMYIYMGMAVNVDVLVWLLFSVYIYLLMKSLKDGLSAWLNIALALVVGLGLWVKQTVLIGLAFYAMLLLSERLIRSTRWGTLARFALTFLGILFLTAGWLYFSGSIATSPFGRPFASFNLAGFVSHLFENWRTYRWAIHEDFWGFFGWLDAPLSPTLYMVVGMASLFAFLSFLYHVLARRRELPKHSLFFLLLIVVFSGAMAFLNYSIVTTGQGWFLQGRYFFPLMAPILSVFLIGLTWFVPWRLKKSVVLTVVAAMVIFHVLALFGHVIPRYYL